MSASHCRHPGCRCEGSLQHDGYCSSTCANAGSTRMPTGGCACGHPGCKPAAREDVR
jgi:hypothetical protein